MIEPENLNCLLETFLHPRPGPLAQPSGRGYRKTRRDYFSCLARGCGRVRSRKLGEAGERVCASKIALRVRVRIHGKQALGNINGGIRTDSRGRFGDRRSAQTFAIVLIILPAFIGAIGLAADVANYYLNYVRLQTAADASVLSGAKYLPDQPASAISTATTYATAYNGIAGGEISSITTSYDSTLCPSPPLPPPPPAPGCKLTMVIHRTVPFYFARLVNVKSGTLNVTAVATAGQPSFAINSDTIPIAIQYTAGYADGAPILLRFQQSVLVGSGFANWWGVMLGGISFASNMPKGYQGKVSINDAEAPDRSLLPGPVSFSVQSLINGGAAVDPTGTYLQHTANDLRAATVVLVDWGAGGGCCRIKSFAQIWVDSVTNGNISAHWIANGVNGVPDTTGTALKEGALAITLTQ